MALVVHASPVDSPRRSTRIRVRRQTTSTRSSCAVQTAVSRRTLPRNSAHVVDIPSHSVALSPKSGSPKRGSLHGSKRVRDSQQRQTRGRSATRSTAPEPPSSRTKRVGEKRITIVLPQLSTSLPMMAGTKRKRSQNPPDPGDRPAYELVPLPRDPNDDSRTPRQLRYAKRQRLLTSLSNEPSSPPDVSNDGPHHSRRCSPVGDSPQQRDTSIRKPGEQRTERSANRERALHRAITDGRLLSVQDIPPPQPPASSVQSKSSRSSEPLDHPVSDEQTWSERSSTPRPTSLPPQALAPTAAAETVPVPTPDHAVLSSEQSEYEPVIIPLHRLVIPCRERRPDTIDTGLWKLACQERVEYLKDVYREVFDAVLQAEALTAQLPSEKAPMAPTTQARFELYMPSTCVTTRVDADGDTDMDAEYSSDWDSDEDEDKNCRDDDDDDDDFADENAPTYDALVALDSTPGTPFGAQQQIPVTPQLPRLSSIRVYALDTVPEQTAQNGVPFMGRGTPVDRKRRADWITPATPAFFPRPLHFDHQRWTPASTPSPPGEYYSPAPAEMLFSHVDPGVQMGLGMQMDMGPAFDGPAAPGVMHMDVQAPAPSPPPLRFGMDVEVPYAQQDCMPWLDPALRPASASPSPAPSPAPAPAPPAMSSASSWSSAAQFDQMMVVAGASPPPASAVAQDFPMSTEYAPAESPAATPSPTGCPWHVSFLQCLQSPGCAPCFAPAPSSPSPSPIAMPMSSPTPAPPAYTTLAPMLPAPQFTPPALGAGAEIGLGIGTGMGVGVGVFPDQALAQFVRSHLVPGSVTLSHALG